MRETPADRFESMGRQVHAARLGMWTFLGSEVLFFSGLFALYSAYRVEQPRGFGLGVECNTLVWGTVNTGVLLVSSFTIAMAVRELRHARQRSCAALVAVTMLLGLAFLVIKTGEYLKHFSEGIYPGGRGRFFEEHPDPGVKVFFSLYFGMTGLHAVHVFVGVCVLTFLLVKILKREMRAAAPHPLEIGAIYWHLVDVIWIFLWPLFYLVRGGLGP